MYASTWCSAMSITLPILSNLPRSWSPYAQRSLDFIDRITDTLSKKLVRKVKNRWDDDIWPWDREGFQRPRTLPQISKHQR
jgi:hypothetical protein